MARRYPWKREWWDERSARNAGTTLEDTIKQPGSHRNSHSVNGSDTSAVSYLAILTALPYTALPVLQPNTSPEENMLASHWQSVGEFNASHYGGGSKSVEVVADSGVWAEESVSHSNHNKGFFYALGNGLRYVAGNLVSRSPLPVRLGVGGLAAFLIGIACTQATPSPAIIPSPASSPTAVAATAIATASATRVPPPAVTETQPPETPTPPLPSPTALPPPTATSAATAIPTETATPTPPTPTPLPPTPVPNPAVVYATSIGLGQDKDSELVVAGLARFGLDYILDNTEKAFIDAVAANPLEVQLAMVNSPYMSNGKLSLVDLVAVADTLQKYHPKQREAVWAMPDKSIQLPSGGSINPSSMLELILKKDAKAVKVIDYMQSRIFDNAAFWEAFKEDKLVTEGIPGTRQTWVRWDAKNWPVKNWQAMATMMLKYDPFSYVEDDLDKILDELGVYPGDCVYCLDNSGKPKTWNLLEPQGSNGSLAYSNLVGSEGNIVREWLKAITHHVWADGEGLLVRSYRANNAEQLRILYGRDPRDNGGQSVSYANGNVSFMTKLPSSSVSPFSWALSIIGDTKDERTAVLKLVDWGLSNLIHLPAGSSPQQIMAQVYNNTFPQNPVNPPVEAIIIVKQTGSEPNASLYTALFKSLGLPADDFSLDQPPNTHNPGKVVVYDNTWYFEGNNIIKVSGASSCTVFGTLEQIQNTANKRRGDGSFCN